MPCVAFEKGSPAARHGGEKEENLLSLDMLVERTEDGQYRILADWLDEPVTAKTFEEAYELALRARAKPSSA